MVSSCRFHYILTQVTTLTGCWRPPFFCFLKIRKFYATFTQATANRTTGGSATQTMATNGLKSEIGQRNILRGGMNMSGKYV